MKKLSKTRLYLLIIFGIFNITLLFTSLLYSHIVELSAEEGRDAVFCVFKNTFNLYCPGCGGSRSLVRLLHFDIIGSFILYPPLIFMLLFVVDIDIRALLSFIKNDIKYLKGFRLNSLILISALILLNFFLRNILLFCGIDLIGDFY